MKKPKIEFSFNSGCTDIYDKTFEPAVSAIPDWYKKMPRRVEGYDYDGPSEFKRGSTTNTIKSCPPFLDAMMSGYVIKTPGDIQFRKIDGGLVYQWQFITATGEAVESHPKTQLPGVNLGGEFLDVFLKFGNEITVKTPPGYSSLFIHPLNRFDLPFHTLGGVVDTDQYPMPVLFPFLLKNFEDADLVIPAGTPIVQVIPFKRESWESVNLGRKTPRNQNQDMNRLLKYITKSYKRQWWQKKSYT
jgi:hypothetical protein